MRLQFRQDKATQSAARLMKMRGGTMSYMKLLNFMYLADRKALIELARPITYDRFVSTSHGLVLSKTFNLMVAQDNPTPRSYWRHFISAPSNVDLSLIQEPTNRELSPSEEQILGDVFNEFGKMDRWKLIEFTRQLPEWKDPQGSAVPISVYELLGGAGLEEDDIKAVDEALAADEVLAQMIG